MVGIIRSSDWTGRIPKSPLVFVIGTGRNLVEASLAKGFSECVRNSTRMGLTNVGQYPVVNRIDMQRCDSMLLVRYYPMTVNLYTVVSDKNRKFYPIPTNMWKPNDIWFWAGHLNMWQGVVLLEMEHPPGPLVLTVWYHDVDYGVNRDLYKKRGPILSRSMKWPQPAEVDEEQDEARSNTG